MPSAHECYQAIHHYPSLHRFVDRYGQERQEDRPEGCQCGGCSQ